ncbi:MAG TPA: hypothetical protein VN033_12390 [Vulgatibacter sp.]|nr:hypothetical protein [Vulgatibacter sp.]
MNHASILDNLRITRFGLFLAVLTIFFGYLLGGAFGGMEDAIKGSLQASAMAVRDTVYQGDDAQVQAVVGRGWTYFKRAHMHGGGIGTASLGLLLLLGVLRRPSAKARALIGWALGLGSIGYSSFWLLAGRLAPGLGGTSQAKEALRFLAFPSAGLLLLGVLSMLVLTAIELFARPRPAGESAPAAPSVAPR